MIACSIRFQIVPPFSGPCCRCHAGARTSNFPDLVDTQETFEFATMASEVPAVLCVISNNKCHSKRCPSLLGSLCLKWPVTDIRTREEVVERMTVQGGGGVPTPQATTPSHMLCGLCGLLCKRATRIACCDAQCCWGCGIR